MGIKITSTEIPEVKIIEAQVIEDHRGYFFEIYNESELKANGLDVSFKQSNHAFSKKHVLRGLHCQLPPHAQAKLVHVISGAIYDVAVDVRKGSPTYGKWAAAHLSSGNKTMMYIPEGFLHGYCVLSESAEVMYFCNNEYAPGTSTGVIWNDTTLNIFWPVKEPILSEKDKALPDFDQMNNTFFYQGTEIKESLIS